METRKRSLAKALSWRIVATVITMAVAFALTREVEVAAAVAGLDTTIKFGAYFVHERLWLRIRFGRYQPTDYQI
ncbi:DUF2061 domain-containing protein [Haliangium sp.]|uniref:DUF2061 domain-containing protein n=1 Tax=Haliangium sp. TaxID=2663208 RepID=UPI003D0DEC4F